MAPPATRFLVKAPATKDDSSLSSPDALRRSAPTSRLPQSPTLRTEALVPQPVVGVWYWTLAGVVLERSAATEAEEL